LTYDLEPQAPGAGHVEKRREIALWRQAYPRNSPYDKPNKLTTFPSIAHFINKSIDSTFTRAPPLYRKFFL
jgi:hypothetical protein